MRWHSAELAGTFWAVVLNGLLAEQPEQPLPWLGAWPSAAPVSYTHLTLPTILLV